MTCGGKQVEGGSRQGVCGVWSRAGARGLWFRGERPTTGAVAAAAAATRTISTRPPTKGVTHSGPGTSLLSFRFLRRAPPKCMRQRRERWVRQRARGGWQSEAVQQRPRRPGAMLNDLPCPQGHRPAVAAAGPQRQLRAPGAAAGISHMAHRARRKRSCSYSAQAPVAALAYMRRVPALRSLPDPSTTMRRRRRLRPAAAAPCKGRRAAATGRGGEAPGWRSSRVRRGTAR